MTKLYIFEGPDGAGKTTVVAHLKQSYEVAGQSVGVVHLNYADSLPLQWLEARQTVEGGFYDVVIMDRSPESELCYGPILRGNIRGTADEWQDAEKILLLDYPQRLVDRAFERGEKYLDRWQLQEVINQYEQKLRADVGWKEIYGIPAQNAWLIGQQRRIWN
jgi:thymidylate kinase